MADFVYVVFKVGDQSDKDLDHVLKSKDGYPISMYDPDETLVPVPKFSDHTKKVFSIIKVPKLLKQLVSDSMIENGVASTEINYRPKKNLISFDDIATLIGDHDYVSKIRGPNPIEPVDASGMLISHFKDTLTNPNPPITDNNSVSGGAFTVGSAIIDDYADWALAGADIASLLTANISFTQTSDVFLTSVALFDLVGDLDGYDFLIDSTNPHFGVPGFGWKTNINFASNRAIILLASSTTGSGNPDSQRNPPICRNINIQYGPSGADGPPFTDRGMLDVRRFSNATAVPAATLPGEIHDIITTGLNTTSFNQVGLNSTNDPVDFFNFIIRNVKFGMIEPNASLPLIVKEDFSVHDCASAFQASFFGVPRVLRNWLLINNTDTPDVTSTSGYELLNCGSTQPASNYTPTGTLTNFLQIDAPSVFKSLDPSSPNYLKLVPGSTVGVNGIPFDQLLIPGNNHGIRGNRRGVENNTSRGADEALPLPAIKKCETKNTKCKFTHIVEDC